MSEDEKNLRGYAYSGQIDKLKELIESGVNLDARDSEGNTALHIAQMWMPHLKDKDFYAITEVLVEQGADTNAVNKYGETPIFLAASEGFYEVVVLLHENGARLDVRNDEGFNPLHNISKKLADAPTDVKLLIERGGKKVVITDPDEIREITGSHPDDETLGYIRTAKYLIENGMNVNQKNKEHNQSPLFHASDEGIAEIVAMILDVNHDDVNHHDVFGLTPLSYASRRHFNVVKLLVEAGANPNEQDEYGFTPLHEAAENDSLDILKYLIKNGGDVKIGLSKDYPPYSKGDTPLEIAKKANKDAIVDYLSTL